jgi:hypothetical protein
MSAQGSPKAEGAAQPVASAATKGKPTEREAFTGKERSRVAGAAAKAVGGVAAVAANVMGGLASIFESLLGGGPSPEQAAQAAPPPAPEPQRRAGPQTVKEYIEAERQQFRAQQKALQELSRLHGREIISEADFHMQEESAKKRDRDRGGGQSL